MCFISQGRYKVFALSATNEVLRSFQSACQRKFHIADHTAKRHHLYQAITTQGLKAARINTGYHQRATRVM